MADERVGKSNDKDPLLSLAVHELRAPVSVMSGFLRMVLTQRFGGLTEQQLKALQEVEKSVARFAGLLEELSELSQLRGGSPSFSTGVVELRHLIEAGIAELEPFEDGRNVTVTFRNQAPGGKVIGDAARLKRACRALLVALRRELPANSALTVSLRRTDRDGRSMLQVTVASADRVDGIEALPQAQLQTLPPSDQGEFRGGIGFILPIARRIVEAHKGQLWCPLDEPKSGAILLLDEARSGAEIQPLSL